MPKFILIYKSPEGFDMTQLPKDQIAKVMQTWGEWLGSVGPYVIDRGDMFKPGGKSVNPQGVEPSDSNLSGYTIIDVRDYDAALNVAMGCPIIKSGGKVEVYEAFGL